MHELPPRIAVVLSVDANQCKGAMNCFSVIQAWCASAVTSISSINGAISALRGTVGRLPTPLQKAQSRGGAYRASRKWQSVAPGRKTPAEPVGHPNHTRPAVKGGALGGTDRDNQGRPHSPAPVCRFRQYLYRRIDREQADRFDQIDATVQYLEWVVVQPPLRPPPPRAVGAVATPRDGWDCDGRGALLRAIMSF